MKKMLVKFLDGMPIVVNLREDLSPATIKALEDSCPQEVRLLHARFAGEAFFFKPATDRDVPEENAKLAADMKDGEVSMYLGPGADVKNAIHFWYGPKRKVGGKAENVFGEFDGDIRRLSEFAYGLWQGGPMKATVYIIDE